MPLSLPLTPDKSTAAATEDAINIRDSKKPLTLYILLIMTTFLSAAAALTLTLNSLQLHYKLSMSNLQILHSQITKH